jgi:hypothetical protein
MAGGNVSEDKVTRMAAWFARHRPDLDSPKAGEYLRGDSERPTPGQVAWLLWGGSLGRDRMAAMNWAERTRDRLDKSQPDSPRKDMDTDKAHIRYPDGEPIPHALPDAYAPAQGANRCDNCAYYKIGACLKWGAAVRAGYWCKAWKPILGEADLEAMHHEEDEMKGRGYMDEDKGYGYDFRKEIVEEGGEFCVYSEGRGRRFGCYDSMEAAEERLAQIESFARSLEGLTPEQLIAAHQLTHKSTGDTMLELARHVIEDRLEYLGFAPPYTTGDTTAKLAALHSVVPFAKAEDRYTLGPVYVPGRIDGHGEFIDSDTLQKAIWDWVRSGDRTIFLQHSEKAAGEMVEILTWPMPIQTSLSLPGEEVRKVEFPAETPFMGVVWESWAWDLVKAGQLRGYSIGGKARRVEADLSLASGND